MKSLRTKLVSLSAVFLLLPVCAVAQTAKEAKAFVTNVYGSYRNPDGPDLYGKGGEAVFTPAFLQAIQADRKGAQALNYDPFCSCADPYKMQFGGVTIDPQTDTLALAQVNVMDRNGYRTRLRLVLLWTAAGWRVDDISTKETPSLHKLLAQPQ